MGISGFYLPAGTGGRAGEAVWKDVFLSFCSLIGQLYLGQFLIFWA